MTADGNRPHHNGHGVERMLKSEQLYRLIVEHANDAIVIIQDKRICFANAMAVMVGGYSREELFQISIEQLICPEDRQDTLLMCNRMVRKETLPSPHAFRLIDKAGTIFRMQANPVRIELEGNPALLILARDISGQKKREAQLFQAQKMEAIGNLASGIAHDFNNILHAISGYAQILAINKNHSDPEYRKLEMILRSTQRGSEMINRLLALSRKLESSLMPLNINLEVIQVCGTLERTLPKTIRIKKDLEEQILTIGADTAQVEQIMLNLSLNARDAMPDGGELSFSTRNVFLNDRFCNTRIGIHPGHHVLLTISDTGAGIDSDTLDHIFEPFYIPQKTGGGTGLDLAMVYGFVKNHNGYILCQSEKDQGTRFQIYFPVIDEERGIRTKAC
jgi:PAS domain S-box-containing protein